MLQKFVKNYLILIGLGNGKTIFEITQVSNENMRCYSEFELRLKNMQVKPTHNK